MATAPNTLTPEEYLRLERASLEKHEYEGGHMFAMAGANRRHRIINDNIRFALRLKEAACGCVSDNSDTRLFIPATGGYTYSDVVMTCGEEQRFQDDALDTLLNPTLIVEVLSPSTENYDRGGKFYRYRRFHRLPSTFWFRKTRCWLNSVCEWRLKSGGLGSFEAWRSRSRWKMGRLCCR
jgi:Uma2 family endonuclease